METTNDCRLNLQNGCLKLLGYHSWSILVNFAFLQIIVFQDTKKRADAGVSQSTKIGNKH